MGKQDDCGGPMGELFKKYVPGAKKVNSKNISPFSHNISIWDYPMKLIANRFRGEKESICAEHNLGIHHHRR